MLSVKVLPDGGQGNEGSIKTDDSNAGRYTIQILRTNENNEEYTTIYSKGVSVQTWVAKNGRIMTGSERQQERDIVER